MNVHVQFKCYTDYIPFDLSEAIVLIRFSSSALGKDSFIYAL